MADWTEPRWATGKSKLKNWQRRRSLGPPEPRAPARCARCQKLANLTLRSGVGACSLACAHALIAGQVSALSEGEAWQAYYQLMARCEVYEGRPGGLASLEADELEALAARLGVKLVWQWFDLSTWTFHEGRKTV